MGFVSSLYFSSIGRSKKRRCNNINTQVKSVEAANAFKSDDKVDGLESVAAKEECPTPIACSCASSAASAKSTLKGLDSPSNSAAKKNTAEVRRPTAEAISISWGEWFSSHCWGSESPSQSLANTSSDDDQDTCGSSEDEEDDAGTIESEPSRSRQNIIIKISLIDDDVSDITSIPSEDDIDVDEESDEDDSDSGVEEGSYGGS